MENLETILAIIAAIGTGLSGPVMALVEAIKPTDLVPNKYLKLLSLLVGTVIGCAFGLLFAPLESLGAFIAGGYSAGMAASALYDTVNKPKDEEEKIDE